MKRKKELNPIELLLNKITKQMADHIDNELVKSISSGTSIKFEDQEPLTIDKLKESVKMIEREYPELCALARLRQKYTDLQIKEMMECELK